MINRFLPQSLFVRIVLIVVGGLLISEIIGGLILINELDDLMLRSSLLHISKRIDDRVTLLESVPSEDRLAQLSHLNQVGLKTELFETETKLPDVTDERAESDLFVAILKARLGNDRHIQAQVVSAESSERMRLMSTAVVGNSTNLEHYSVDYWVQLRLRDGEIVRFHYEDPSNRPSFALSRLVMDMFLRLVMVIVVALATTRLAMRPLKQLANSAEALGRDLRREPMPETGLLEVRSTARTFNQMQTRLMNYLDDRTRILAAISHDLRTPLTRLRIRLEMLEPGNQRVKLVNDVDEMRQMVEATLDFVRGVIQTESDTTFDLLVLLNEIHQGMGEEAGRLTLAGEPTSFQGKYLSLKRCLVNLIENALRYGESADVRVIDQDEQVTIVISDKGPGIAVEELDRVFEPFYRIEGSRSKASGGIGLGLSIARDIAQAHGGQLLLSNRCEGGLDAILILPRHLNAH